MFAIHHPGASFRFWRSLTGVEYSAIETRTFTLDQTHGTVASPLILHPEGFFQVIPLKKGWNWIGFPRLTPEPVNSVLAGLTPSTGNILKSQNQFAAYDAGVPGWVGNLNLFKPGEGYKLFLTNPGNIVFESSRGDGYAFDAHLYEYNMNVTGYADLSIIGEREEEDFIVGAFIDGECRGIAAPEWVEALNAYRYLLLVNGNIGDLSRLIEFRLLNEATGAEYVGNGQPLSFIADGLIGTVGQPYPFFGMTTSVQAPTADGYHLEQNLPNPVSGLTQIAFRLPQADHATLTVYDFTGKPLFVLADQNYPAGRHTVEASLENLPAGVYMYELVTREFSGVRKLIKQ